MERTRESATNAGRYGKAIEVTAQRILLTKKTEKRLLFALSVMRRITASVNNFFNTLIVTNWIIITNLA
jgi:hypothetical protein